MTLIHSLVYLAAIGVLSFAAGRLLPKRLFKAHRFPYRPFAFELDGRIYQKLRIGSWQARVPDMSRILPMLMPAKRIRRRPTDSELVRMIQETCVAEFIHFWLSIFGVGVMFICPDWRGIVLYAAYFLLGNLPFMLIQRYNRPRLVHMLDSSRRRAEQMRRKHATEEKRVLILSCNTGEGHNSCANAIREAFEQQNLRCDVDDALRFISKTVSKLISEGHVWIYRHAPWLFRIGYRYSEQHPELFKRRSLIYRMLTCGAEPLYSFLVENGYDAVVCSHVFAAMMLTEVKHRHPIHLKTGFVATDYTGYPAVEQCSLDYCFVPDQSLIGAFTVGSIAPERVVGSGIPVRQSVYRYAEPGAARHSLDIPADCRHLLVMCGSMGCGPIPRLVKSLAAGMGEDCFITVVCGTNRKLRRRLERRFAGRDRIRILGYTDQISLLMDSADLYLTKPGGMSVSEAAVKNLPMVMIDAVAGCEEHNRNFFLKLGLGVTARSPEELAGLCLELLGDPSRLNHMRACGKTLYRCNAAECIRAHMLDIA